MTLGVCVVGRIGPCSANQSARFGADWALQLPLGAALLKWLPTLRAEVVCEASFLGWSSRTLQAAAASCCPMQPQTQLSCATTVAGLLCSMCHMAVQCVVCTQCLRQGCLGPNNPHHASAQRHLLTGHAYLVCNATKQVVVL
jgi:hypothetical protein